MKLEVKSSQNLKGDIVLEPNKSHSFRALIFASLANGKSKIVSAKKSKDWTRAIKAMRMYGAKIEEKGEVTLVEGTGKNLKTPDDVIDCGNSGQIFRFFMGVAACCKGYSIMTGDHSIRYLRHGGPLIDALNQLGATAISTKNDGHAPVIIKGKIKGGKAIVKDGSDSQPVTGLLIGCALAEGESEIIVKKAGEKPWIGMTLYWFDKVGIKYENIGNNFDHYKVKGNSEIKPFEVEISKDWSAALYPILAAIVCPNSEVRIKGLDPNDPQGDKMAVDVLKKMGAKITVNNKEVIAKSSQLKALEVDCNDFVDQFMLLAMAAAYAKGTTRLYNAEICRKKECDRIKAMYDELTKMGVKVKELKDGLIIEGGKPLQGAKINGYNDHRMVMTFAAGALQAKGKTEISDAESIEKSFTSFVDQMKGLNANFQLKK
jgi:3-phosphoshikimate 1-carboxyvinyltransferase